MTENEGRTLGAIVAAAVALAAAYFFARKPQPAADAPPPIVGKIEMADGRVIEIDRDADYARIGAMTTEEFERHIDEERKRLGLDAPPPKVLGEEIIGIGGAVGGFMKSVGKAAEDFGIWPKRVPAYRRMQSDPTLNAPRPASSPSRSIVLADKAANDAYTTKYDDAIIRAAEKFGRAGNNC